MKESDFIFDKQQEIAACMFDLGNGEFVRMVSDNQKFRSLIVDVDEHRGTALGLCPTVMMLPWSFTTLKINTENIESGREATAILLEEAAKQGVEIPAVEFCHNYTGFGVEKGKAFLPTNSELRCVASRAYKLKSALAKVGFSKLDYTLWSSSVGCDKQVWMQSIARHAVSGWHQQMRTFGVVPMIEIVL